MIPTEEIIVSDDVRLKVDLEEADDHFELSLHMKNKGNCRLHWGLSRKISNTWKIPSERLWPAGSIAFGDTAIQTPFESYEDKNRIKLSINKSADFRIINFAFYYPSSNKWDNNHGKNYHIELPMPKKERPDMVMALEETLSGEVLFKESFKIDDEGMLSAAVTMQDDRFQVYLITDIPGTLLLHWGVAFKNPFEWSLPPEQIWPPGTTIYDDKAVQTEFVMHENLNRLKLEFNEETAPLGIHFVLTFTDEQRWLNNRGRNIHIPVAELLKKNTYKGSSDNAQIAREIVQAETGQNSWTLMHRFNLCHDLLDRTGNDEEGLALIYVWMRYSFLRQLDWQRNYNTKPRELSHAQDRLTLKLADMFINGPDNRELIILIMSTLGRGGEGQRIRDEILKIMHRHHIKEVGGSFMEEWHQKLHNNTTPDDIVICEAYLEFLKSDGNRDLFYSTLEGGGVTKERLESFERPIVTHPDFIPHLKDGLIYDFENYLKLLRSVHSGTDLEGAAEAAGYLMDQEMRDHLDFILHSRHDASVPLLKVAGNITRLRNLLNVRLANDKDKYRVREMIYIDLAIEDYLRVVVERNIHVCTNTDELVELIGLVLENQIFSFHNFELSACSLHWKRLNAAEHTGKDWALHAKSVLDRLGRAIADLSDRYYRLLQDNALYLGDAFYAEKWTINLFSEEIVRGRLSFILSLLLHHLDPLLRKSAHLGDWQVISPGQASGVIEVVQSLSSVQDRTFDKPTIIIADKVRGDEEPPSGLRAVITPDLVDLVAHVAIRARNSGILFATCYDRDKFERLKSMKGENISLRINPSGDVEMYESAGDSSREALAGKAEIRKVKIPSQSGYVIMSADFREDLVGGKSLNLVRLKGKLPEWIHLPSSVAIPFGVAERTLSLDNNKSIEERIRKLLRDVEDQSAEVLSDVRKLLLELEEPPELVSSLRIVMDDEGLGWTDNWDALWICIKRVWASKWNDRAFVSRRTRGIADDDLYMAVLVQQVVKAEYAFVIHTSDPVSGDSNELYAEVVPGLGETLVGNYPGKALGFSSSKKTPDPRILSYPSKSVALSGGGLIFRSDSNGEDLAEYAGAGLYDSVMVESPRSRKLSYTEEPIVWDDRFRHDILSAITSIGIAIEQVMGSPQDIEGVYSNGKYHVVQTRPQI
jgi:alpha-glucan,water dikinase